MATNNAINVNESTPMSPSIGGTGVSNGVNTLTITGNSTINQNVTTTATPAFVNVLEGFSTTATAAATTTLVVGSNRNQEFTGVTTQTVTMPVTSTLVAGQEFYIINNSTGVVTVQSSGANTIQALSSGTSLLLTCISTSGTTAASWQSAYLADAGVAPPGSAGTILRSSGTAWLASTSTFADTYGASTLLYSNGANTVAGLATANNGLLVTSAGGVPSIGNAILADITINGLTAGRGTSAIASNTAFGSSALLGITNGSSCTGIGINAGLHLTQSTHSTAVGAGTLTVVTTGSFNTALGSAALGSAGDASLNCTALGYSAAIATSGAALTNVTAVGSLCLAAAGLSAANSTGVGYFALNALTSGANNTGLGTSVGGSSAATSVALVGGSSNTLVGYQASTNNATTIGSIAIGANAVSTIATGATSADNGPGIAIGSATFPVGFRGDGSIYPGASAGGFWRAKLNGTAYMIPLYGDGASDGPLTKIVVQVITSTATYTPTLGMKFCIVEIVGGGGGSGGSQGGGAGTSSASGGGGGGGYCRKTYTATLLGATAAVVIGTGGAGGSAGNNNGSTANNSTFTPAGAGAVLTATGGAGGGGMASGAGVGITGAAVPGTGTNGDLNITGEYGGVAWVLAAGAITAAGNGGASFLGMGTQGRLSNGNAAAFSLSGGYGAGAGGATSSSSDQAGVGGQNGVCYITEFVSN